MSAASVNGIATAPSHGVVANRIGLVLGPGPACHGRLVRRDGVTVPVR